MNSRLVGHLHLKPGLRAVVQSSGQFFWVSLYDETYRCIMEIHCLDEGQARRIAEAFNTKEEGE